MAKAPIKSAIAKQKTPASPQIKRKSASPAKSNASAKSNINESAGAMHTRFYDALISFPDPRRESESERRSALSLIQHIADYYQQLAANTASKHGLHVTDHYVVIILSHSGTDCIAPVAELQRKLGFTSGGVTRCLDRMVTSGLVVRVSDPDDGRAWMAQLTRKGRALAKKIGEAGAPRIRGMYSELSAGEWQVLNALLKRISNKMPQI